MRFPLNVFWETRKTVSTFPVTSDKSCSNRQKLKTQSQMSAFQVVKTQSRRQDSRVKKGQKTSQAKSCHLLNVSICQTYLVKTQGAFDGQCGAQTALLVHEHWRAGTIHGLNFGSGPLRETQAVR
jgi:hypothetical protein